MQTNTLLRRTAQRTRAADGTALAYASHGAGSPVVLLHGLSESQAAWEEAGYVAALVERGHRVVAPDARGHGASGKPREAAAYAGRTRLGDLVAVLDHAGVERAVLVGHSMGGVVALAAAALRPERVAAAVAIGAHPFADDLAPFRAALAGGLGDWIALLEAQAGPLSQATLARLAANDVDALRASVAQDRPDFSAALARSARPVLALLGTDDPRHAAAAALAAIPGVAVRSLPGRNHATSFTDAPAVLAAIEGFLAQHTTGGA